MSMGLCPTRASCAREPRYDVLIFYYLCCYQMLLSFISAKAQFFPFLPGCEFLTVLALNDGVMHVATQRPPYLFFFFFKTFLTTTPSIKISYLFTTKLEKNWSR